MSQRRGGAMRPPRNTHLTSRPPPPPLPRQAKDALSGEPLPAIPALQPPPTLELAFCQQTELTLPNNSSATRDFEGSALPWGEPDLAYLSALLPGEGPSAPTNVLTVSFDKMTYPIALDGLHTVGGGVLDGAVGWVGGEDGRGGGGERAVGASSPADAWLPRAPYLPERRSSAPMALCRRLSSSRRITRRARWCRCVACAWGGAVAGRAWHATLRA